MIQFLEPQFFLLQLHFRNQFCCLGLFLMYQYIFFVMGFLKEHGWITSVKMQTFKFTFLHPPVQMHFTGGLLIPNAFIATACSDFLVNMRKLSKDVAAILTDVFSSAHYCSYHHFLLLSTFMQPTWNAPVCSRSHVQIFAIGADFHSC